MVSLGEKAKIKKSGNLKKGRSYVITTVSLAMIGGFQLVDLIVMELKNQMIC